VSAVLSPIGRRIGTVYEPGDITWHGAKIDGSTDDTDAWNSAIALAFETGSEVFHPGGTSIVSSALVPLSGIMVRGIGSRRSIIKASANTFSIFNDGGTARSNVSFRDIGFDGNSVGSSNRCVLFDADAAASENIEFLRCRFSNVFRGAELDRVEGLDFIDCTGTGLGSSVLYVGESNALARSSSVFVRGVKVTGGDTAADASGTGVVFVGYADGVKVLDSEFDGTGAASGATTLHHAVYLRSVTDAQVRGIRSKDQRRGAGVHIFSDTGGGDARSKRVTVSNVTVTGTTHYAGIRIDEVDSLAMGVLIVEDCFTSALYLTNSTGVALGDLIAKNNDVEGNPLNEVVRLSNVDLVDSGITLVQMGLGDYADDAAAEAAGVPIGGMYNDGGAVRVRIS